MYDYIKRLKVETLDSLLSELDVECQGDGEINGLVGLFKLILCSEWFPSLIQCSFSHGLEVRWVLTLWCLAFSAGFKAQSVIADEDRVNQLLKN
jgi:hypothetical protein